MFQRSKHSATVFPLGKGEWPGRALAVRSNWGWLNHVGRWVVGRGLCIVGR